MKSYTVKNQTKIYKGKFRSDGCRPVGVLNDRPSWFFLTEKPARIYSTRNSEQFSKKNCWVVTTFKTKKELKLIDLSDKQTREIIKNTNYEVPIEWEEDEEEKTKYVPSWAETMYIIIYGVEYTLKEIINNDNIKVLPPIHIKYFIDYCFPSDNTRTSDTEIDLGFAIGLKHLYKHEYDGWYIKTLPFTTDPTNYLDEEIMLFNPSDKVKLEFSEEINFDQFNKSFQACLIHYKNKYKIEYEEVPEYYERLCFDEQKKLYLENGISGLEKVNYPKRKSRHRKKRSNKPTIMSMKKSARKSSLRKSRKMSARKSRKRSLRKSRKRSARKSRKMSARKSRKRSARKRSLRKSRKMSARKRSLRKRSLRKSRKRSLRKSRKRSRK